MLQSMLARGRRGLCSFRSFCCGIQLLGSQPFYFPQGFTLLRYVLSDFTLDSKCFHFRFLLLLSQRSQRILVLLGVHNSTKQKKEKQISVAIIVKRKICSGLQYPREMQEQRVLRHTQNVIQPSINNDRHPTYKYYSISRQAKYQ